MKVTRMGEKILGKLTRRHFTTANLATLLATDSAEVRRSVTRLKKGGYIESWIPRDPKNNRTFHSLTEKGEDFIAGGDIRQPGGSTPRSQVVAARRKRLRARKRN